MFQSKHSFKYCKPLGVVLEMWANQQIKYSSSVLILIKQMHGHTEKEKIGLLFRYNFPNPTHAMGSYCMFPVFSHVLYVHKFLISMTWHGLDAELVMQV